MGELEQTAWVSQNKHDPAVSDYRIKRLEEEVKVLREQLRVVEMWRERVLGALAIMAVAAGAIGAGVTKLISR